MRVQEHAFKAQRDELPIEIGITVFCIARNDMAGVRGMHANLMRAAGVQQHFHERRALAEELNGAKFRERRFARRMRPHGALAADAGVGAQGHVNARAPMRPVPLDERKVTLLE